MFQAFAPHFNDSGISLVIWLLYTHLVPNSFRLIINWWIYGVKTQTSKSQTSLLPNDKIFLKPVFLKLVKVFLHSLVFSNCSHKENLYSACQFLAWLYFVSVSRPRKAKSQTSSPAKNFSNESSKVDAVAGNNPAFLSRVQFKCEP